MLNELDVFLHKDSFLDYTARVMQRLDHEVNSNSDGGRECIALFVYSFSEVIISAGLRNSMGFLSSLIDWANQLHFEDSISSSSCIVQFCATQLRPDTVAQLQDLLTTVAIVVSIHDIALNCCYFCFKLNTVLYSNALTCPSDSKRRHSGTKRGGGDSTHSPIARDRQSH